jgi:hypothetical protein
MIHAVRLLGLAAALVAAPAPAQAPAPAPGAAPAAADASATVTEARKILSERYVLPDTATKLDAALAAAERRGDFKGLSGEALADKMDAVLREVTPDGHLSVRYDPQGAAQLARTPPEEDHDDDHAVPPEYAREIARGNGGVEKLMLLPGNIRYLEYDGFMWGTPEAEGAIRTAMEFLRGGDALIIDIRKNGGGSPGAVAAIVSYFLPAQTKLMRFEMRGMAGEASETSTAPFSLADKPLYVLTSKGTFSAAEEFADHIAAFKIGTLVGENTGGGGFRNMFFPLPGGQVMSVSVGRAVHMVTGKDWERVGIPPAIAVPADQALARAQLEAVSAIAAKAPADERDQLVRLGEYYQALATPVAPGHALADYAGQYGPRVLAVDASGALTVSRSGRPPVKLIAVGADLFVPETAPTQRFRFLPAEGALEVDGPGGAPARFTRSVG